MALAVPAACQGCVDICGRSKCRHSSDLWDPMFEQLYFRFYKVTRRCQPPFCVTPLLGIPEEGQKQLASRGQCDNDEDQDQDDDDDVVGWT